MLLYGTILLDETGCNKTCHVDPGPGYESREFRAWALDNDDTRSQEYAVNYCSILDDADVMTAHY